VTLGHSWQKIQAAWLCLTACDLVLQVRSLGWPSGHDKVLILRSSIHTSIALAV